MTLDRLAQSFRCPTVIRIDVEGAENLVLQGAERLIRAHRPILVVEESGGTGGGGTVEMLRSLGYVWGAWDGAGVLSNEQDTAISDIVAIPSEHSKRTAAAV